MDQKGEMRWLNQQVTKWVTAKFCSKKGLFSTFERKVCAFSPQVEANSRAQCTCLSAHG